MHQHSGTAVDGLVEPGFERVADAFAANFAEHGEVGAGFCLHVEGRKVVDVWGGYADETSGRPYDEDTLQLVFSTTKGATAVCANLLAQRGELELDAPVARYWPEFAGAGKETIPVRWLLCHKAGLPTYDAILPLEDALDWDPAIRVLEAQAPLWKPGTAHGYHAITYGWLVGEVVRRVTGRTLGTFFADEVAAPLGLDFWIGLPDEHHARVAPVIGTLVPDPSEIDEQLRALFAQFVGPESLLGRALSANGTFDKVDVWNRPDVLSAEVPSVNGVTNARSLSRMYAALIGDVDGAPRLLSAEQVDQARHRETEGNDRVIFIETGFGLGFMVTSAFSPFGGPGAFGHYGAGGSVAFADPEHGIAFGYVMNRMMQNLSGDPRTFGLIRSAYESIGARAQFT